MLNDMIAETFCLVHGRHELRLRLVGVEAVVGDKHHMIDLCHFICRRQHTEIARAAAVKHHHKLGVFTAEFKIFHLIVSLRTCSPVFAP